MTWTGKTFAVGQTLSHTDLNNLHADFTAMCNGDTNAPKFIGDAFPDELFGDTKLSTSATFSSTSVPAYSSYTFTANKMYMIASFLSLYQDIYIDSTWYSCEYGSALVPGNSLKRVNNPFGTAYYITMGAF